MNFPGGRSPDERVRELLSLGRSLVLLGDSLLYTFLIRVFRLGTFIHTGALAR